MSRELTPRSSLESLRKEAKRWLKAIRDNDEPARARLVRSYPNAPTTPGLRDVQHALAREHGMESWTALTAALADRRVAHQDRERRVDRFLEQACPDWRVAGPAQAMAHNAALRLLRHDPGLAHENLYTAIVSGDVQLVQRLLRDDAQAVTRKGGPRGWEPLLYLGANRLPVPATADNAVEIAQLLLDHGADPNAYYPGGSEQIHYTVLTTVVGEGEESAPSHPQARALVALLLDRGAEPYDIQVFYNTHFNGNVVWLLELVHARSLVLGREADWKDPQWSMIDMGGLGKGARYFLDVAIAANNPDLATWVLERGADPNAAPPAPRRGRPKGSLHSEALRRGATEIADLLVRYGAVPSTTTRTDEEEFIAACFRLDRDDVASRLARQPEYRQSSAALFAATRRDRVDVVEMLLDLGVSVEVQDNLHQHAMHEAASNDAVHVAELLVARGGRVDPREDHWNATPYVFAIWGNHRRMIDFLGRHSRDLWNLAFAGKVDRLRELLDADPGLAKSAHPSGVTPLMRLPDDESRAREIVALFLSHGADPTRRNAEGRSAADLAEERGMFDIAAMLRA